jgi:hypothetical protein
MEPRASDQTVNNYINGTGSGQKTNIIIHSAQGAEGAVVEKAMDRVQVALGVVVWVPL